jgi:hypothetical protein
VLGLCLRLWPGRVPPAAPRVVAAAPCGIQGVALDVLWPAPTRMPGNPSRGAPAVRPPLKSPAPERPSVCMHACVGWPQVAREHT